MSDLVERLRKRAEIRRQIPTRKSVQEGKPDRIADLLEEAADEIIRLNKEIDKRDVQLMNVDLERRDAERKLRELCLQCATEAVNTMKTAEEIVDEVLNASR